MSDRLEIIWTEYLKCRARLRGFDLNRIAEIVRFSSERYFDTATGRYVAVGRHGKVLVIVPYEIQGNAIIPVTVHATTRHQIRFRVKTGRYV